MNYIFLLPFLLKNSKYPRQASPQMLIERVNKDQLLQGKLKVAFPKSYPFLPYGHPTSQRSGARKWVKS